MCAIHRSNKKIRTNQNSLAQGKKFAKSQVHKYIKIKPQREDTAGFSFDEKDKLSSSTKVSWLN